MSSNIQYHSALTSSGLSYVEEKLKRLALPNMSGKSILDIGCNSGYFSSVAASLGAKTVIGLDIDKNILDLASKNFPELTFINGNFYDLPHQDFDIVFLFSVLHYASNPYLVINEIINALANDGLLIYETGLIDDVNRLESNTFIPVWREVGDLCIHPTYGCLFNLLHNFNYNIIGPSANRMGDPVNRYVIHANLNNKSDYINHINTNIFELDVNEFIGMLAISSQYISDDSKYHPLKGLLSNKYNITEIFEDIKIRELIFELIDMVTFNQKVKFKCDCMLPVIQLTSFFKGSSIWI